MLVWKRLGSISVSFDFAMVFVENGGFGASPLRTSVASIPAVSFFLVYVTFEENMIFDDCSMNFLQNDYNLS